MSTRRRSRSRSRDKKLTPAKLRMDTKPQAIRISDPSLPAGRRREIDNVMKKARAQKSPNSGVFWDKKLLEVEAKDPNRWRHSGYKSLYIDEASSPSSAGRRSRSRSPPSAAGSSFARRSSPPVAMRRRSPRSPPPRFGRSASPASRALARRRASPPPIGYRGRSPPLSSRGSRPTGGRPRSPPSPREPPSRHGAKRRSVSNSSISSCSDDSCSVCSPKGHRNARSRSRSPSPRTRRPPLPKAPPSPPPAKQRRARPPSPPARRPGRPSTPPAPARPAQRPGASDRPTDPRRQPPPPRPRGAGGEVISVKGVRPPAKQGAGGGRKAGEKGAAQPMLLKRIKKERLAGAAGSSKRPGSPGESSGSEDSGRSPTPRPIVATTSLTLSERFGKIAQWSADRERRDMENMRITKTGTNMKVLVEEEFLYGSPPRRYSLSPVPSGQFPDKLLSSSQSRTAAWDDVRVRYQYYKDLGYLRDLTLDDYVKWEEWWYKYQDWLANERHYEHWLSSSERSGRRRGGKKRLPASQRLN